MLFSYQISNKQTHTLALQHMPSQYILPTLQTIQNQNNSLTLK